MSTRNYRLSSYFISYHIAQIEANTGLAPLKLTSRPVSITHHSSIVVGHKRKNINKVHWADIAAKKNSTRTLILHHRLPVR